MVTVRFKVEDLIKSVPNRELKDKNDEPLVLEDDIYKYITDTFNAAGVDAELRYQDTDYSLIIMGEEAFISIMIDIPEQGLVRAIQNLADELNSSATLKAFMSYKNKEYSITIEEKSEQNDKEKMIAENEEKAENAAVKIRAWNPEADSISELKKFFDELQDSISVLIDCGMCRRAEDYVDITSLPSAAKYQETVNKYSEYPIWACDYDGTCLVGDDFEIENLESIIEHYKGE